MDHTHAPLVIIPVPAFKDNYLWLIRRGRAAVVVDPGDAAPVEAALRQHGLSLDAILLTHHHPDHMGGVDALVSDEAASLAAPLLFCGDTLFACGCGRLFEGTAAQMHASLTRLAALPGATRVYCAHEYTLANIRFARAVEPANAALAARETEAIATRARRSRCRSASCREHGTRRRYERRRHVCCAAKVERCILSTRDSVRP